MNLTGNKADWTIARTFLKLLSSDFLNVNGKQNLLFQLYRHDPSGIIQYRYSQPGTITLINGGKDISIAQEACIIAAREIDKQIKNQPDKSVYEIPEVQTILSQLQFNQFRTENEEKCDFILSCLDPETDSRQTIPCITRSQDQYKLLPAQRTTNFKYDILNIRLANPEANKINRLDGNRPVQERLKEILARGAKLKFTSTEEKIFQSNLSMSDLHMPKLVAEIVRLFYTGSLSTLPELIEKIKSDNPFKLKEELITKNNFYEYKIKQLLFSLASGMRPARIYRGYGKTLGWITCNESEPPVLYHPADRQIFDQMLYQKARLTEQNPEETKSGWIEKENGQWLIKLNLEITL